MTPILDRLRDWSGLFGLVFLRQILMVLVTSAYKRIKKRIDRTLPDDMPLGSGEWLLAEIARRKLALRVVVDPRSGDEGDSFYPAAKTLVLSREVYGKRDPSFWAVAAHELGHALVYTRSPFLRALFFSARVGVSTLPQAGALLLLGNVLYGFPLIDAAAFALLKWSLVAHVVVLIDEATASIVARRILAADPRVSPRALTLALTRLAAAFSTYAAAFVGQAILVWRSDWIIARIEREPHDVTGAPLGSGAIAFILGTGLLVVVLAIIIAVHEVRPRRSPNLEVAMRRERTWGWIDVGRGVLSLVVVGCVWNQPSGLVLPFACVGAVFASQALLGLVGMIASFLVDFAVAIVIAPFALVAALVRTIAHRAPTVETNATAPVPRGAEARFDDLLLASYNEPPWYRRVFAIAGALVHVAFVAVVAWVLLRGPHDGIAQLFAQPMP